MVTADFIMTLFPFDKLLRHSTEAAHKLLSMVALTIPLVM
jgi:hypothetical protein